MLKNNFSNNFSIAPWIILSAICLHLLWAGILFQAGPFDSLKGHPLDTVPLSGYRRYPFDIVAGFLFFSSLLAIVSFFYRGWIGFLLLALQQTIMITSAMSAVTAVIDGSYADGVLRPMLFILADQAWTIVGAVMHTFAILDVHFNFREDVFK